MWFRRGSDGPVTDEDLSAFADGRLPPARAARVASHLRAHPADADRIHAYWHQEAALYRTFEPVLEETVPPVRHNIPISRNRLSVPVWPAAAVLVLAVTAVLTVWKWPGVMPEDGAPDLAATALQAYTQKMVADRAVNGVAPEFPVLDLKPVGLRRIEFGDREVTEYRYRNADGHRLALYSVDAGVPADDGLFRVFGESDTRLVEWTAHGKRYALVGKGGAPELTRLAVQLRNSMTVPTTAVAGAKPASNP